MLMTLVISRGNRPFTIFSLASRQKQLINAELQNLLSEIVTLIDWQVTSKGYREQSFSSDTAR